MRLTTEDLEALASVYAVSVNRLMAPPDAERLVDRMERAQSILDKLSERDLERWLAIGESLADP